MRTVKDVSKLTSISVRTLHYYDEIGLLKPTSCSAAGYRLYDDKALERLQQILFSGNLICRFWKSKRLWKILPLTEIRF